MRKTLTGVALSVLLGQDYLNQSRVAETTFGKDAVDLGATVTHYADSAWPEHKISGCCGAGNTTLGADVASSEYRLEHLFEAKLEAAKTGGPDYEWYVFTDGDTWWHARGLAVELERVEALLLPATPEKDVLLVGGGGLLIFSEFMVVSRRALDLLGNRTFMDSCRANLYSCSEKPLAPHSGCRFMANRRPPGNLYMANQLVHYCLTPYLQKGKCGKSLRSCEYRFGESGGTPGGATAARQRFVSVITSACTLHPCP